MDRLWKVLVLLMVCMLLPAFGFSAEPGGNSGGCGDVFGDLVHIKRHPVTGQPILQKRWIEYPGDVLDWGYCPIPLDADGNEIPFVDLSCDPDPSFVPVEVDYFGRLSGGRTKERNSRMHFNEVISTIKIADVVTTEETGRLKFGFDCQPGTLECADWSTVDSPMENLALYSRIMRYGHFQTDPMEEDISAHGDPALGTQYHPALDSTDWTKFTPELSHLLPATYTYYGTETLENDDFIRAAAFLGSAANKEGRITVDLVQYMNRILKITQETELSLPNVNLLPALIRDCGDDPYDPWPVEACETSEATEGLPAPGDEMFVDFRDFNGSEPLDLHYIRQDWFEKEVEVLRPVSDYQWEPDSIQLLDWLLYSNGSGGPSSNIAGFVDATSDSLRAVQFVHEYAVPEALWDFASLPVKGDLTSDGKVDDADFSEFQRAYGSCSGDAAYLQEADLDNDGCVSVNDYRALWLLRTE